MPRPPATSRAARGGVWCHRGPKTFLFWPRELCGAASVHPAGRGVLVPLSWCSLVFLSILLAWDCVSHGQRRAVTPLAKYFLLRCGCWAFWSQKARAAPSNLMSSVPVSLLGRRCWSQATPRTMWRKSFPMAWMRAVAQTRKRTVSARSQGSCAPCLSRVGSAGGAAWDPRDCAEPKCDLVARRSCVGSSRKRARVQHCPAATLAQLFSVCRAVGSTPCPVLYTTSSVSR